MNPRSLYRASGACGIAAGLLIIAARVFEVALFPDLPLSAQASSPGFVLALGLPGLLGSILLLLSTVGLYARQAVAAGPLGAAGYVFAFVTLSLSLGANWAYAFAAPFLAENARGILDLGFDQPGWGVLGLGFISSYLLGVIGWIVLSLITLLTGEFPRWVGIGMLVSMLLAATLPFTGSGAAAVLVNLLIAAGPMMYGCALWRGSKRAAVEGDGTSA
jgi:hypothetical protein